MKPTLGASSLLDRLSHKRSDTAFLDALVKEPSSRFLLLVGHKPVIVSNEDRSEASTRWFSRLELAAMGLAGADTLFLGVDRQTGAGHFAVAITDHRARAVPGGLEALRPTVDLRTIATQGIMPPDEVSLIGKARALAAWHDNARCCGHCGGTTNVKDGGWRRKCWACGLETFPRIDPVVIMLVTDGSRCVLGHEPRFPASMYSAIAGYLEPGEDLDHAVRRETFEEIGLEVDDVRFHSTQPWPFPHSLMIGCFAHTSPRELKIDYNELTDARWFSKAEVKQMLDHRHAEGLWVPGHQAIANILIKAWVAGY